MRVIDGISVRGSSEKTRNACIQNARAFAA
jgi:hypothetical protein